MYATRRRTRARGARTGGGRPGSAGRLGTVLAHPLRLAILERLVERPRIVSDLIAALSESQPEISKQLATLRHAGLLDCAPDGRCRMYRLANPRAVRRVLRALEALAAVSRARVDLPVAAG